MRKKFIDLSDYVERANTSSLPKRETRLTGIHLYTPKFLIKKIENVPKVKNPRKMEKQEFDSKKVSFIRSAYATYKCCEKQNLYLFQLKKIYLENNCPLKRVARWRLPKKALMQASLGHLANALKESSDNPKKHFITRNAKFSKN